MVFKSQKGREDIQTKVQSLLAELPYPVETRYVESQRFGRTHCLLSGDKGKPVMVLLHGASSNSLSWAGYMAEWQESYRLIVPDIPGQPGLSCEERPRVAELTEWLDELTESLELEEFYLCGMSLGGWISIGYTLAYQDKVRGLALIATSGLANPRLSFFLRILPLMMLGERGALRINRLIYGSVPIGADEAEFGFLVSRHFKPLTEPLALYSDEELAGLTLPVYYAGGEEDPLLDTIVSAERIPRTKGGVRIEVLPDRAHVILDRAGSIESFFQEIGRK